MVVKQSREGLLAFEQYGAGLSCAECVHIDLGQARQR